MRMAIIQLSDLHIASADDYIVKNAVAVARSCKAVVNTCDKAVVVVTGDIIDKGKVDNYAVAKQFFDTLKTELLKEASLQSFDYVFVPGNHDLDFGLKDDIRPVILNAIKDRDVVSEEQFVNTCLAPQNKFWEFVTEMEGVDRKPCVSYSKSIELSEHCNLVFHCYNTAFLSTINEQPQELLVPENFFLNHEAIDDNCKDVVCSIFHHKTGWLSTKTSHNNQRAFCDHIEQTSQILMCGHEHQSRFTVLSDLENADKVLYLESNSMQQGAKQSFCVHVFETDDNTLTPAEITIKPDGTFEQTDMRVQKLESKKHALSFTESHSAYLSRLDAPIKHPTHNPLNLEDIYVYPDLEPLSSLDNDKMFSYIDAESIVEKIEAGQIVFLEGESQCGKTALLKMMIRQSYQKGVYPILITGSDLKIQNMNGILRKAFKDQYVSTGFDYNGYLQLERSKRAVFIDNIDKSPFNQEGVLEVLKLLLENYDHVIVTTNTDNSVLGLLQKSRVDDKIKRYLIHPLGHVKRNQLIERWILLGTDRMSVNTNAVIDMATSILNKLSETLGKQLLPSNPIFLLILLQEMNIDLDQYDTAPTSYANLYQSLLLATLHKQGVPQSNFNGIIQFLSEMAYMMYKNKKKNIRKDYEVADEIGYSQFYDRYVTRRNMPYTKEKLLSILTGGQLLIEKEPESYSFTYKYIYFYLVANYISSLKEKERNDEIKVLCEKLYKEENGNILVFLAYLDKEVSLLDEIKFACWLPFEKKQPITLDRNDDIYNQLETLVKSVSQEVLRTDVDQKKERKRLLEARDKQEMNESRNGHASQVLKDEDFEKDETLQELNNMMKATRIIGQIIKNQRDLLLKDQIVDLLTDAYLATFRSLSFFTELLKQGQDEIVDDFITKDDSISDTGKHELEEKVNMLFQLMLLRICLSYFTNLSLSVGTSGINDLYDVVAKEKIKSPAADVITFTIKSYFGNFSENELDDIVKKYNNNIVVLNIIRARVRSYVYTHNLPYDKIQSIGAISGMQLLNSPARGMLKGKK